MNDCSLIDIIIRPARERSACILNSSLLGTMELRSRESLIDAYEKEISRRPSQCRCTTYVTGAGYTHSFPCNVIDSSRPRSRELALCRVRSNVRERDDRRQRSSEVRILVSIVLPCMALFRIANRGGGTKHATLNGCSERQHSMACVLSDTWTLILAHDKIFHIELGTDTRSTRIITNEVC